MLIFTILNALFLKDHTSTDFVAEVYTAYFDMLLLFLRNSVYVLKQ